jgi:hypothetical protein
MQRFRVGEAQNGTVLAGMPCFEVGRKLMEQRRSMVDFLETFGFDDDAIECGPVVSGLCVINSGLVEKPTQKQNISS